MNNKQRSTYNSICEQPTRRDIRYQDIESLLLAFGLKNREGRGSRVTFILEGTVTFSCHKPHGSAGKNPVKRYVVDALRRFFDDNNLSVD